MRITNGILQLQTLSGLQRNMQGLATLQEQISSGRRITRPSQDPVGVSGVMRSTDQLSAITQYKRNLEAAGSRQGVEEQALGELTLLLERARELATSQGTGTASAATRLATAAEVDRLLDFAVDLGNTEFQGRYLFGGDYADREPFPATDPTAPPQGELKVEIGPGRTVGTNHSGQEVFLDTGVFTALQTLSGALRADDGEAIRQSLNGINAAFDGVQEVLGDLGARQNNLEMASQNLDALEVNLESLRSTLQDTDLERAVTELVSRQSTFQAALAANARILGQSLADYLR